jgi:signal transduction histidine kinase
VRRSWPSSRAACCSSEIRDDGVGGARWDGSSGLLGLRDRAAALAGELRVQTPAGEGTVVAATLAGRPVKSGD